MLRQNKTNPIPTSVLWSVPSQPRFARFSGDGYSPPFLHRDQGIAFIRSAMNAPGKSIALLCVATFDTF